MDYGINKKDDSMRIFNGKFYILIRNILFKFDPEAAHYISLEILKLINRLRLCRIFKKTLISEHRNIMGLSFPNPVGLAAGFDKNGDYIDALASLGFGFLEIGTVTPRPQPGNPKPRLFRLTEAEAIINRMGFNNKGIDYLIDNIKRTRFSGIIGVNIGKNFDTPIESAYKDYQICLQRAYPYAHYITINISSPNTLNLRKLQSSSHLKSLLEIMKNEQMNLKEKYNKYVPLVVKLSPDISEYEIESIADILAKTHMDGVVATNTTISRDGVEGLKYSEQEGGLSGLPLRIKAEKNLRLFSKYLNKKVIIIASGGIMSLKDAKKRIEAGADLIQLYTGLIYRGPRFIRELVDML